MRRIAIATLLALSATVFAQLATVESAFAVAPTIAPAFDTASVGFGGSVNIVAGTATGDGGPNAPLGTLTFHVAGGSDHSIGLTDNGDGTSSYAAVNLGAVGAGSHNVSVDFTPSDGNYDPINGQAVGTFTVTKGSTSVAATASNGNPPFGSAINIGIDLTGAAPLGGSLSIKEGQATAAPAITVNGAGHYQTSDFTPSTGGSHTITVTYVPDANHTGSSDTAGFTVGQAGTTISTPSANPPAPTFGQTVTVSGTVSSSGGTPTGTVSMTDNGNPVGATPSYANGNYSVQLTGLTVGSHSFVATFHGTGNFADSPPSGADPVTVGQAPAVIQVPATASSPYGAAYSITGTVSSLNGQPTGNVTIKDGATTIGTPAIVGDAFTLSMTLAQLGVRTHTLTVSYAGDVNFGAAANQVQTLTVTKAPVTVLVSGPTAAYPGLNTVFTISVAPTTAPALAGAALPGGTVNAPGSTGAGTLAAGDATVTLNPLAASANVQFTYSGDGNYATGNVTQPITFTKYALILKIVDSSNCSSPGPSCASVPPGFPMPLTAVLTLDSSTGQPTPPAGMVPTGNITFSDSLNNAFWTPKSPQITNSAAGTFGQFPTTGSDNVTASYAGNANFAATNNTTGPLQVGVPNTDHNTRYVFWVYHDVLGRTPDPGGTTYWAGLLNSGVPRPAVAWALVNSNEYRSEVIAGMYHDFLNRGTDAGGLNYWVNQVAGGMTFEWFESFLIGSDEYYQSPAKGHGDPATFVNAMYQDILGRGPDVAGRNYFVGLLNNGTPRAQVVAAIVFSTENLQNTVNGYYQHYLGRNVDAGGENYWVGQLQAGARDEVIVALIIGSDEYFSLV